MSEPKKEPNQNLEKAKRIVEEGIELLKTGFQTAETVAGKTVEITKLHYNQRKDQLDLYRTFHDLGMAVYERMHQNENDPLKADAKLLGLYGRINDLQKHMENTKGELKNSSLLHNKKTGKK
ncbi:MAG: hypothetical protein COX62_04880 [Deltaproteobacteria bacterium CG_4_10_14_0_2_um_filter_43_8]|nr:MAG: hypothetical protein COV43_07995 [Deltaproteobacteria bacterium CG11_big_fil_rev_8_21_14_0_20_42_23]PJA20367.1 MAG: hypothetical protein COX62_04880 [Deltaproteobacteria bacterium CG_4_10_14_0_2_um_filter_43_8]PJC64153.1 MAG: hypothetical protein CO021_05770 [Deltaproteobacteria bacterium CG_4_9_14_0_2_um_filter_42_21]